MKGGGSMVASAWLGRVLDVLRRSLPGVVFLGVVFVVAWFRLLAPVDVELVRVERGTIVQEGFGRGTIESEREAGVGFDMVGRLSDVLVDEGSRVTLGQELARLETNQAEADLRSAQTGLVAARSSLLRIAAEEERARTLLATAEREATRTKALFDAGAIADAQRDEATDRLRLARADLDRVLAQRAEATRGIDVAAGGAEQRRVTMVRATLLAPFDGLITRRLREPGDTVAIGTSVLRIVDTDRVHVNAAIDETVLPQLALDQRATITFPGTKEPLDGKVSRIGWEADRQTHELIVEVTPARLERRVAIGQRADIRVELGRRENALRIPMRMVHHDEQGAYVYANRDGKIALVRPKFGVSAAEQIEVLEGLSEGDVVFGAPRAGVTLPIGRRWEAL